MEFLKKFIFWFGVYNIFGRVYHTLHSKPNPKVLEKIAAIFTEPGSDEEAKFMGVFGFHKTQDKDDDKIQNKIGF